jgi:phosphohistidine swiveling domain-containing protein/glycerol-3-phosphate acyltransferase PlsY
MTLMQVWGAMLIFIVCPLLGGLPLIAWITFLLTGTQLSQRGTGNISVSAAFYHGGRTAGILAVLSEAGKGIVAVLLARYFFPNNPEWELVSLIALVMGRYWIAKGAGTTNVVWGFVFHDPVAAGLVFLISMIGFTLVRERKLGKYSVLVLFPIILALLNPSNGARIGAAMTLACIMAWIYQKVPDDLDLSTASAQANSQKMFRFFRGDRGIPTLDQPLDPHKVGQKAATLSQLKRWGYPVPAGWVLNAGDDPQPLIEVAQPSEQKPLAVRSSAVGEDSESASAAGQYQSFLNITHPEALQEAIVQCLASYDSPTGQSYRQQRNLPDLSMSVLVQEQISGVFSGVAFSRDPIDRQGDAVVIEALPGNATRVVSGQVTPEQYRVEVPDLDLDENSSWIKPADLHFEVQGSGDVPPALIQQVAFLARHLESRYHGIPQDIEWTYNGQTLWLLQARPVTTLLPIWTRKIAAEVIPGLIRPLTWSINRPLTCGVWGELFTVVLKKDAADLEFNETATLHYSRAYFNASLLTQIFRRMGLPAKSLEFLTRGAKLGKPPLAATLKRIPGLLRLLKREWSLEKDFEQDYQHLFAPLLNSLVNPLDTSKNFSSQHNLEQIEAILTALKRATYYSILAPLSFSLRQSILKVKDAELKSNTLPEVAALKALQELAADSAKLLPNLEQSISSISTQDSPQLFATLSELPDGQIILEQFEQFLDRYGYLSEVGTDIAVPTWKEDPRPARVLFTQYLTHPPTSVSSDSTPTWKTSIVQRRLNLKGRVTEIYSQLLAQLRWHFVVLENDWLQAGILSTVGDIFFLEFAEVRRLVANSDPQLIQTIQFLIESRQNALAENAKIEIIPQVVYGYAPPIYPQQTQAAKSKLQGVGASPGQVQGRVKILRSLQAIAEIDRQTILVVPYTDSGWAPALARAGGLISEVGGRLSHGAIVAREYGLPAVMDVNGATHLLRDGQPVRIDGSKGIVEILE